MRRMRRPKGMKLEDTNIKMIPILKTVFLQAIAWGKFRYILFILIGSIISIEMFFWIKLPQITTDVIYTLFTEEVASFYQEITPVLVMLLILLVFQIARSLYQVIGVRVRRDAQSHFELSLIQNTSFLPWEDYENAEFKSKLNMINQQGPIAYQNIAIDFVEYVISTFVYIAVYVAVIMELGILNGFIFLGFTLVYFFVGIYFGKKYYETVNERRGQGYRMWYLFRIGENKETHQDLIVNRGTRFAIKAWEKEFDEYMNITINSRTKMKLYLIIPNVIFAVLSAWLIYTVIHLVAGEVYTIGYFTLVITTIISYKRTLEMFAYRSQYYKTYFELFNDYLQVLGRENEPKNSKELLPSNFNINLQDISYKYIQSEHKALNRFNLSIQDQETIAIVGENGSGKTTFTNLMGELTKRYDGRILVNDKNIKGTLGILRNSIAIIFQDFQEYQVTIKENIKLGDINREITDEEVIDILKQVKLYEDIKKLPNGIDTMLGQIEEGTEFSKGQWQRLAVARMLAKKDAKIWILDEPTAYLDPIAEIDMYDFIYSLKGDRTVIFISHRLGFARKADRIVLFEQGQVLEEGTHKELISKDGKYAKMFEKQKSWYE